MGYCGGVDQVRGSGQTKGERRTHMWMGSHEREVIHFEWPLSASPIGLPVFGSQTLT
jgi:hypothetical protein